jgi:hypothetical protein
MGKLTDEDAHWTDFLKNLDFYKYLPHGIAQPSLIGATTSCGFILFMSAITFYQVVEFLSFRRDSEVLIDFTLDD